MERKKEAIALLSMYNDEDMDLDDEDDGDDDDAGNDAGVVVDGDAGEDDDGRGMIEDNRDEDDVVRDVDEGVSVPEWWPALPLHEDAESVRAAFPNEGLPCRSPSLLPTMAMSTPPVAVVVDLDVRRSMNGGGLTIVDYAHDEGALSPDAEEGEILAAGRVMLGAEFQGSNEASQYTTVPGSVRILTPSKTEIVQSFPQTEELKSEVVSHVDSSTAEEPEADLNTEAAGKPKDEVLKENIDPLENFLPPPPTTKCPAELQAKIIKFLGLMSSGRNFNEELRKSKGYRNPDFLQHAVSYQEIDPLGTCFIKDVFDPYGYDKSDYYDEIEAEMKREMERKEQEKKKNQKIEFSQGGLLPTPVVPAPRAQVASNASTLNASAVPVNLPSLHPAPSTGEMLQKDARQNKKSKWDKVDSDRKIPLPAGGQDPLSAVGAHAALLSAANAGAGYTAFAQQKRKEAAEKRSSEKVVKDIGK